MLQPSDADVDREIFRRVQEKFRAREWDYVARLAGRCATSPHLSATERETCFGQLVESLSQLVADPARDTQYFRGLVAERSVEWKKAGDAFKKSKRTQEFTRLIARIAPGQTVLTTPGSDAKSEKTPAPPGKRSKGLLVGLTVGGTLLLCCCPSVVVGVVSITAGLRTPEI